MSLPLTQTKALLPLLGAGLLIVGAAAAPAFADGGASSAVISNLTPGQSISGTVEVDIAVHNAPAAPLTAVTLGLYSLAGQPYQQTLAVPASCTADCTLTTSLDTAQTTALAGTSAASPLFADGTEVLVVRAAAGRVLASTALTRVVIDNHRPTATLLGVPDTDPLGLGADQSLTVQANAVPAVDALAGTTVTSLQLVVPGRPEWPVITFAPDPDGSWAASADTSAIPAGVYSAEAIATDSNGTLGNPVRTTLVVDHGFSLHLLNTTTLTPDALSDNGVQYDYGTTALGCGAGSVYAAPQRVDLYLDGKLFHSASAPTDAGSCVVALAGTYADPPVLPVGHHQLRVVVTDDRGHFAQTSAAITVALPLTLAITPEPSKGAIFVGLGSTTVIKATESAPDGFSTGYSWNIREYGTGGTSTAWGTGTAIQPVVFTAIRLGGDTFDYTVQSDNSLLTNASVEVVAIPTTITALALSTTRPKRGSTLTLTAHTTQTTALASKQGPAQHPNLHGATVELQFQAAGSRTWTTRATATTSSSGSAVFHEKATANGTWRIVTLTRTGTWFGSTSTNHTTTLTK